MELSEMPEHLRKQTHQCPQCRKLVKREDMDFTHDCHGIPFRLCCLKCVDEIKATKGYDGEYYTAADEQIDDDY